VLAGTIYSDETDIAIIPHAHVDAARIGGRWAGGVSCGDADHGSRREHPSGPGFVIEERAAEAVAGDDQTGTGFERPAWDF
jgi:hypothetical protein